MNSESTKRKYSISLWAWALNEEALVEDFVRDSVNHLKRVADDFEIILIDDGSTDRTWELMQKLSREHECLKIIKHDRNRRPGFCMHTCLKHTTKDVVFWNTVDSFFDTSHLEEWLNALEDCDMIQGVRSDLKANSPYRKLTHLVNRYMIRVLFGLNISEFQNVKFCHSDFLKKIGFESASTFTNPECSIKGFWSGLTIKEKGMKFLPRAAGKAKGANPSGILESLRDILKYWFKWIVLRRLPKPIKRGRIIKMDGSVWPASARQEITPSTPAYK